MFRRALVTAFRRVPARLLAPQPIQSFPACHLRAYQTSPPSGGDFVPENAMERLLMAAAKAKGKGDTTKMFHQELMEAECVYVIRSDDGNGEEVSLQALKLQDGNEYIPFFTSLLRLQDFCKTVPEGQEIRHAAVPPRVFLEVTKDSPPELMVNPGSPYGKFITKREAASLLDGTYLAAGDGSHSVKASKMLLRKPKPYPEALLAMLAKHFKPVDDLEAAYVMQWYNSSEALPHIVIALDAYRVRTFSL